YPWRTWWFDPALEAMERKIQERFPKRNVEMLGWDDARDRFLLRVSSAKDPKRYFVLKSKDGLMTEILRRVPTLRAAPLHQAEAFAFETPAGVTLDGTLVVPRASRVNPPPLLIWLRD